MTRRYIELIEIYTIQPQMKIFHEKPRYKEPFVIETKFNEVHTALIKFCQESELYYFQTRYAKIPAEDVVLIEDRIWDHIKI